MSAKVKVVESKHKDISDIFSQLLGVGTCNFDICYPKYRSISETLNKLIKATELLGQLPALKQYSEFETTITEIEGFVKHAKEQHAEAFSWKAPETQTLEPMKPEEIEAFGKIYEANKTHKLVSLFVSTCNQLIRYKLYIEDPNTANHEFILRMPGTEFVPLAFSSLNIKRLVVLLSIDAEPLASRSQQENEKYCKGYKDLLKVLVLILNKIYSLSYNLYKIVSSPDVDVEEFSRVVIDNIDQVKKQIPRCEKAFNAIRKSIGLLKSNFGKYYRDFTETGSQTAIMESFILDVATDTKTDPETIRQFREIMKHYKKIAASQSNNPQLKMLFDNVNQSLTQLEDNTENIKEAESQM
jgi:hypothetical protein